MADEKSSVENKKQELPDLVLTENKPKEAVKVQKKEIKQQQSKKEDKKTMLELPKSTDSLQDLMAQNIKLSQAIFEQNKKIKHRLTMMVLGNYLKLVLILIPLVFAIIYLPPLLKQVMGQYSALLGGSGATPNLGDMFGQGMNFDIGNILSNLSGEDAAKLQEAIKNAPK